MGCQEIQKLISERGISFEDVAKRILNNEIVDLIKNPAHVDQFYFVISLNGYIHVVPFVISDGQGLILKTIFPSRKFQKKYGRKK